MGTGDVLEETRGHELGRGAFSVMPAKLHHFAWTTEPAVIQLHAVGPWGITYVDPRNDPRLGSQQARQ